MKCIGLKSQRDLTVILAAIEWNSDGYLDCYEMERLRAICRDAIEEYQCPRHPLCPWTKSYTSMVAPYDVLNDASLHSIATHEPDTDFTAPSPGGGGLRLRLVNGFVGRGESTMAGAVAPPPRADSFNLRDQERKEDKSTTEL